MKFLLLISNLLLVLSCTSQAQNTPAVVATAKGDVSEMVYPMPANKKAVIKLPYARSIKVRTWDRAAFKLVTIIKTTKPEYQKAHVLEHQDSPEELVLKADLNKAYFGDNWHRQTVWCNNCDSLLQRNIPAECYCLNLEYEILMPAGTALNLESISGDIEIRGLNGPIRAKSISGFVDIDRPANAAADLELKSVTGEIYTDFAIQLSENSSAYSKKVAANLNGGGSSIRAESVSGDIYFRKRER